MWFSRIVDLHKTVRLFDQDFFGEVRMTEQIERLRTKPEADRIPVLPPPGREGLQRMLPKRTQVTKQRHRSRNID